MAQDNMRKIGGVTSGNGRGVYIRREQKKKRKKITQRIIAWTIVIALAALIVFGIVKLFGFIGSLFKDDFQFTYTACENWPECASISEVKKDYAIGIQYPLINSKTDTTIKKDAEEMLKTFKAEIKEFEHGSKDNRPVYTANYSIIKNSDIYVSLLYTIHRTNPMREVDDTQYIAKIYDISTGKVLKTEEIFNEEFTVIASDYVKNVFSSDSKYMMDTNSKLFTQNTKAEFEDFQNIGFTDNAVTVYYSAGDIFPTDMGAITLNIPMSKIYKSMLININGYTAPLYDADKPMLALTFDDGPRSSSTSKILDVLESVGGRATFFVLGERVAKEKDIIKRADSLGCEYGNHSWNHKNLSTATEEEILEQISKTDDAVFNIIGKKPALARAPFAATNETVFKAVNKPFVGWAVDTADWDTRNSASIVNEILSSADDGDIILMHDIYSETASAIAEAIPKLVEQGYQLVTVSELMEARNINFIPGKVYHNAPIK